jgi:hypothetical protein
MSILVPEKNRSNALIVQRSSQILRADISMLPFAIQTSQRKNGRRKVTTRTRSFILQNFDRRKGGSGRPPRSRVLFSLIGKKNFLRLLCLFFLRRSKSSHCQTASPTYFCISLGLRHSSFHYGFFHYGFANLLCIRKRVTWKLFLTFFLLLNFQNLSGRAKLPFLGPRFVRIAETASFFACVPQKF